jgi:hypothetical protein
MVLPCWCSRTKQTTVFGAVSVPVAAQGILLSAKGAQEPLSPTCVIKGNINRKNECIYHMPGSRF